MQGKTLETPYVYFEIDDGILILTYKPGLSIGLDIAKSVVDDRLKFSEGKSYPLLILDMGVASMDIEARNYFSNQGTEGVVAGAFMLTSAFTKFFVNFYLTITKPKPPSKVFTDKAEAIKWLKEFS